MNDYSDDVSAEDITALKQYVADWGYDFDSGEWEIVDGPAWACVEIVRPTATG